ncbi:hypothetical protein SCHPADRAFT_900217, partial [Schizopora paradoxa]
MHSVLRVDDLMSIAWSNIILQLALLTHLLMSETSGHYVLYGIDCSHQFEFGVGDTTKTLIVTPRLVYGL